VYRPVAAAQPILVKTIMIRFNGLHFWLAFLGVFATSAMLVVSLVR